MKQRRFCVLITAVLLAVALVSCVATRGPAVFIADAPRDPGLIHGVLPNGFQYFVMKNATPKDRVSVHLNVFTGSVNETDGEQGLAHFLEHMVFNGSEHFKPGELITYFQSIGMDFGGDANASTSFFRTVYDLDLPKGDQKHLEDGLLVLRDYAGGALLLQSEIDRERGVILAEKRERDSVSSRTFQNQLAFELPGSILPRRMPIGKETVIKGAGRELFKGYYDRWYRPDNMALVVVGDVDTDLVRELIKNQFASLEDRSGGKTAVEPGIAWQPHKGIRPYYYYEPEAGNTEITLERLEYKAFVPETPDRLKERTVRFLGDLMMDNRLSRMVRDQTADFTRIDVYTGTYLRNVGITALQATCAPDRWEASLSQMENSLRQALTHGFQAEEYERVKADYIASLESDLAGADTRKSRQLARSVLSALNRKKLFLSPQQRLDLLKPFVEALDLETVNAEFQASWEPDHRLVIVTGNAKIDSAPLKTIMGVYDRAAQADVTPYVLAQAKPFPYLELPKTKARIGTIRENVQNLGITQATFDNHVRLNLKPTDFKKGEFRFKAVFGNGRAGIPEELAGFSYLVQSLVRESGLGRMDMDQLEAALAGKEVSIGFEIRDSYFSLEGTAESGDSELVFQLLYACLNDPGFRDTAMALAKGRYRQTYEAMNKTPDGMMRIQGSRFLAGGDPRFGMGEPDRADLITLPVIENWLRPQFSKAPLEVSFSGDFDPEAVLDAARVYLGAMAGRDAAVKQVPLSEPLAFPAGQTLSLNLETKIDKGVVWTAFLTDDYWDIMQTRKLSMLARVFSERLRKQIRETLGASYSPYVYNNPSVTFEKYGVMQAVVNTAPDAFDVVIDQVRKIAEDLAQNGVSDDELALVKAPVMNRLKVLYQDNKYWLNSVMADSFRHPEQLDWSNTIMSGYGGITAGQLSDLARRYLKNETLILIRPGS